MSGGIGKIELSRNEIDAHQPGGIGAFRRRRCTSHKGGGACGRLLSGAGLDCPRAVGDARMRRQRRRLLRRASSRTTLRRRAGLDVLLRQLLGQAEQALAPGHLGEDVLRPDAGLGPEHDQIVEQIGAFADHRLAIAVHGVDDDLDRLLGELLGHLGAAGRASAWRCATGRDRRSWPRSPADKAAPANHPCVYLYTGMSLRSVNAAAAAQRKRRRDQRRLQSGGTPLRTAALVKRSVAVVRARAAVVAVRRRRRSVGAIPP